MVDLLHSLLAAEGAVCAEKEGRLAKRLLGPGEQVRGPGAEAVEDCGAVDGVERVDNVNAQADPIPAEPRESRQAWRVVPTSSHAPCPLNPNWVGRSVASALRVSSERIMRFPKTLHSIALFL